jgi:hypothetical protein
MQLPEKRQSVVHLGLETLDGWIVEAERYSRIVNTIYRFDANEKHLLWIYCHLFQSYAPPTEQWVIDETVYHFSKTNSKISEPLQHRSMIVPHEGETLDGVHWLRKMP